MTGRRSARSARRSAGPSKGSPSPTILPAAITRLGRPARRTGRLRGPIERDSRGPADGLLRRPAGHLPERRGASGDPRAHQPVLGLALHRAGRDLPLAEWIRSAESPNGRDRAADGLPAGGRHPLHGRPRHVKPEGRLRGGQLRTRRSPGLRSGERGRLPGARRRDRRQGNRHQATRRPTPCLAAVRRNCRSSRSVRSSRH